MIPMRKLFLIPGRPFQIISVFGICVVGCWPLKFGSTYNLYLVNKVAEVRIHRTAQNPKTQIKPADPTGRQVMAGKKKKAPIARNCIKKYLRNGGTASHEKLL
jgi:hypothetical protein